MTKENGKTQARVLPDLTQNAPAPAPLASASKDLVPAPAPAPAPQGGENRPLASNTTMRKWRVLADWRTAKLYPADFVKCPDDATITCLITANPKRQSSQIRLQGVINGTTKTVGEYRKKWGTKLANADFSWDVNHGFYVVNWDGVRGGIVNPPVAQKAA